LLLCSSVRSGDLASCCMLWLLDGGLLLLLRWLLLLHLSWWLVLRLSRILLWIATLLRLRRGLLMHPLLWLLLLLLLKRLRCLLLLHVSGRRSGRHWLLLIPAGVWRWRVSVHTQLCIYRRIRWLGLWIAGHLIVFVLRGRRMRQLLHVGWARRCFLSKTILACEVELGVVAA